MATTQGITDPRFAQATLARLRDYLTLTKPEVNLLILMTTSAGYYLAAQGPVRLSGLVHTLIGTLLVASGTATLNQWMERRWDGQMRRTAGRPLPSGRIRASEALLLGLAMSILGAAYLAFTVNFLSAFLATSTLLSYLLIYTPLKRKTPLCTLLGAFPGAMPTLIGWAGAAGKIDRQAWFLFALLFLWQFPHFLAIALMYREDYSRAGYRMLPDFDADSRFTRAEIVGFTAVLIVVTMLPMTGSVGPVYWAGMSLAGAFMMYHAIKLAGAATRAKASNVLHASVLYLPVVLGLMVAWKK